MSEKYNLLMTEIAAKHATAQNVCKMFYDMLARDVRIKSGAEIKVDEKRINDICAKGVLKYRQKTVDTHPTCATFDLEGVTMRPAMDTILNSCSIPPIPLKSDRSALANWIMGYSICSLGAPFILLGRSEEPLEGKCPKEIYKFIEHVVNKLTKKVSIQIKN